MAVGRVPNRIGAIGSETSTKAAPVVAPTNAYSFPVDGSVQPQESFPCAPAPPKTLTGICAIKSYPSQGYCPAKPFSHGNRGPSQISPTPFSFTSS